MQNAISATHETPSQYDELKRMYWITGSVRVRDILYENSLRAAALFDFLKDARLYQQI